MFDLTSRMSYKTVHNWYQELIKNVKEEEIASLPMVLIGNKTDVKERQVKDGTITFHKNKAIEYFELSVKKEINCKEPWLALARKLMKDNTLDFVN
jgi:GTP-binding nuclear protein Ran